MQWRSIRRLTLISVLFVVGILLIGLAGYRFYLEELYPPPPPDHPAAPETTVDKRAQRVVIVVVDAGREDLFLDAALMPNIERIASKGRRGISITQPVTMTLLSVLNLGTGRTPGLGWSVHNFDAEVFPDESIFYWAHATGRGVAFAGDASWQQLFGPWASDHVTFTDGGFYDAFEGNLSKKDNESLAAADLYLGVPDDYSIVVVHLTSTDKVSHREGAVPRDPETGEPTQYGSAGFYVDEAIGKLWDDHQLPGDLWLITSDHGATDTGNHGGGEYDTRRAPFVLVGAGVVAGEAVEVPLNTWAPSLSAATGLPVPRTAETPIAFDLFDYTPEERRELMLAHAERRREFVSGIATDLGADQAELEALTTEEPGTLLKKTNGFISELREHRRWLYVLAVLLGIVLHITGLSLVLRHRDAEAKPPGRKAVLVAAAIWLPVMSIPFYFDHWLFRIVDVLGHTTDGTWYFGRAGIAILTTTFIAVLVVRWLRRRDLSEATKRTLVWLTFAVVVMATNHIVVKWPYGPLSETYLVMFSWAAMLAGWFAFRTRGYRTAWFVGTASIAAMILVFRLGDDENLQLLEEHGRTMVAAFAVLGGATLYWTARVVQNHDRRTGLAFVAAVVAMLAVAVIYRFIPEPTWARVALTVLGAGLLTVGLLPLNSEARRDGIFIVALTTAHIMSTDWIVLMSAGMIGVVAALSTVRLPRSVWTPAVLAAAIGVIDIGFFYVCGYRYSFTAMDARTTFMLDHSGINLAAGFFLLLLQHSVIWMLVWAAVLYNRMKARDGEGLNTAFIAVILYFLIRSWGPFFALEFKLLNHWYVSTAVPMFVMTLVECGVSTFWFLLMSIIYRDDWRDALKPPVVKPRIVATALQVESGAAP